MEYIKKIKESLESSLEKKTLIWQWIKKQKPNWNKAVVKIGRLLNILLGDSSWWAECVWFYSVNRLSLAVIAKSDTA